MEFEKVIKERFSVRKYQAKEVEEEKLLKVLEAGRIAPTAKNKQPQRIYVLKSAAAKAKLGETIKMTYGAPVVLMVCVDLDEACTLKVEENYNTGEMDASIVCTHMMLEAWSLGLGSVWIRYFNAEELRRSFDLPQNIKPICLLPLGYADSDAKPMVGMHDNRKPLTEEVFYL